MRIILSNIPGFIIKRQFKNKLEKSWVYFGSNQRYLQKLRSIFHKKGVEINYGEKLYEKSKSIRSDYVKWLDTVAVNYSTNSEWMYSAPAVRNTYISNLFLNVCYFKVFQFFIEERKEIDFIFVDSPALSQLMLDNFPAEIQCLKFNRLAILFRYGSLFFKSVLRYFRYLIDYILRFISAKLVFKDRSKKFFRENKKIVLIRNFITGNFSDSDNDLMEKHFFPGLYKHLKDNNLTPVFLPVIIKPTNYLTLFSKVLVSKRNIFIFEEFLLISDYCFAFLAPLKSSMMKIKSNSFQNTDIQELLQEDFFYNLTSAEYIYAILLSRFGMRLKEVKCSLEWMINWSENQTFEKGIIKGLRAAFRDIKVIGAQPFIVPPNYLSPVYSQQEQLYDVLPDRILSLGPMWKGILEKHIDSSRIEYSPAFRYFSVVNEESVKVQGNSLLVLLGIDLTNSVYLLSILLRIHKDLTFLDEILIKLHPASNFDKKKLESIIGEKLPNLFNFIGGRLEQYFERTSVGFCGASGTSVELVMKGIPVVTLGETHTLTMNYLEYKEDCDVWQICFSAEQALQALKHFHAVRRETPNLFANKANEFKRAFIAISDSDAYWKNCYMN